MEPSLRRRLLSLSALSLLVLSACAQSAWVENGPGTNAAQGDGKTGQESNPTPINPADPPGFPTDPAPPMDAPFETCTSRSLQADVDLSGGLDNLKDFQTTLKRYPLIKVREISLDLELLFNVSPKLKSYRLVPRDSAKAECRTTACAEAAGWTQVQHDLEDLNGVTVQCLGGPAKVSPTEPQTPRAAPGADDTDTSGEGDGLG